MLTRSTSPISALAMAKRETHILTIVILATFCQIRRLVQKPHPNPLLLRAIRPLLIGQCPSQLDSSRPAGIYAIKAIHANSCRIHRFMHEAVQLTAYLYRHFGVEHPLVWRF